jgi:collagenase-like PrtC family protease
MFFSIPYNGDICIFDDLPRTVNEIYGATNDSVFLNGRAAQPMPFISQEKMISAIKICNENGIRFSYLFNAPWQGNQQFSKEFYEILYNYLSFLTNIGIYGITITLPNLLVFVKKYFSNLKVTVSKFARVNNVQRIEYWEQLGADRICLDGNLTKNINELKVISKNTNLELQLLVNDACLPSCPFENCHAVFESNYSEKNDKEYTRYFSSLCKSMMYKNLSLVLRSTFIRPEDLNIYFDIGIKNFKIVDRNKPTWWIKRAIDAYSRQNYQGNLGDILSLMADMPIFINNKELDGYLNEFFSKCNYSTCHDCNYCDSLANKCIKYIKDDNVYLENIEQIAFGNHLDGHPK